MYGCVYCLELARNLNDLNIEHTNLRIDKNHHIWAQIVAQTGCSDVPAVFITEDSSTGRIIMPERDYQTIEELIEIIKNEIDFK